MNLLIKYSLSFSYTRFDFREKVSVNLNLHGEKWELKTSMEYLMFTNIKKSSGRIWIHNQKEILLKKTLKFNFFLKKGFSDIKHNFKEAYMLSANLEKLSFVFKTKKPFCLISDYRWGKMWIISCIWFSTFIYSMWVV